VSFDHNSAGLKVKEAIESRESNKHHHENYFLFFSHTVESEQNLLHSFSCGSSNCIPILINSGSRSQCGSIHIFVLTAIEAVSIHFDDDLVHCRSKRILLLRLMTVNECFIWMDALILRWNSVGLTTRTVIYVAWVLQRASQPPGFKSVKKLIVLKQFKYRMELNL